jgi:hypothetical protein
MASLSSSGLLEVEMMSPLERNPHGEGVCFTRKDDKGRLPVRDVPHSFGGKEY